MTINSMSSQREGDVDLADAFRTAKARVDRLQSQSHPVQTVDGRGGRISAKVTLAAYEVYSAVFAPQEALITGDCRGGFGTGELIAFLYARNFPRQEWRARFDEAMDGMEHLG